MKFREMFDLSQYFSKYITILSDTSIFSWQKCKKELLEKCRKYYKNIEVKFFSSS